MSGLLLILLALAAFTIGYILYGGFLVRHLKLDPKRPTPAHTMTDGIDYVPAKAPVLMGHHFASIAGASPIIGPITAAIFGWLPVFLWVVLGSILIGGVHDFSSIVASIRHRARSVGEIIHEYIGDAGKRMFLIFAWSTLILVIAVFAILVAKTFTMVPASATASLLFIFLALVFGLSIYRLGLPLGPASVVGVALLLGSVWLGIVFPLQMSQTAWVWVLLGYIFVASVTPVWILLQPRDYLNSFLLYLLIIGAVLGIIFGNPKLSLHMIGPFKTRLGYMFPILFVTVACGAISGFHSLVASGTTAKQLDKETDARIVGYGSMLMEGLLAVVALLAAGVLTAARYGDYIKPGGGGPIALFAASVGGFMTKLGIPENIGTTFAALAISAFALTSLDTATRLARFSFQEFFMSDRPSAVQGFASNRFVATAVSVAVAGVLALSGRWHAIWPIFGSANQLLAAIALLAVAVWLSRVKIGNLFVVLPMIFMFAVTISALVLLFIQNLGRHNYLLALLALGLLTVALGLAGLAFRGMKNYWAAEAAETPP